MDFAEFRDGHHEMTDGLDEIMFEFWITTKTKTLMYINAMLEANVASCKDNSVKPLTMQTINAAAMKEKVLNRQREGEIQLRGENKWTSRKSEMVIMK